MRTLNLMLAGAASALVLSLPAAAQSPGPSKDNIQIAQRGPDGGGGGGGRGGGGGGGGPSAGGRSGGGGALRAPGGGGGRGPGPSIRQGRGGDGPAIRRGGGDGPRFNRGGGDSSRFNRGGDGPRVNRGDRDGPSLRSRPSPRHNADRHGPRGPYRVHRPGPGFNAGHVRRHGRHFAWGGLPFWFYNGYYYGDCEWLYRRAVATGSSYWWDRYRSCRYWDW